MAACRSGRPKTGHIGEPPDSRAALLSLVGLREDGESLLARDSRRNGRFAAPASKIKATVGAREEELCDVQGFLGAFSTRDPSCAGASGEIRYGVGGEC